MSIDTGPRAGTDQAPVIADLTRHQGTALDIYCFPPAGMGPACYLPWAVTAPPDVGVHAIHLPGREAHPARISETDPRKLTLLIADCFVGVTGTFAFFGHSSGALLAYETVLQLRRNGRPCPVYVAVSGLPAPHDERQKANIIGLVLGGLDNGLDVAPILPEGPGVDVERKAAHYAPLVADSLLILHHEHKDVTPLDIPVSIYAGADDPMASRGTLERWNDLVSDPTAPVLFPGGHQYLTESGSLVFARLLKEIAWPGSETR